MSEGNTAVEFKVESWEIGKVLPYPNNPRTISEIAVEKVADAIKSYGWRQPIVVDEGGVVIVGHTRLKAAQKLGLASVPVHVAANLTPAQVRAYRIADNRVGEETSWDANVLLTEIGDLIDMNVDMGSLGFDRSDIDKLLGDDFAPELFPERGTGKVSDKDVQKTKDKLADDPKRLAAQDLIDLTCPHCGNTYAISKTAIA